MPSCGAAVFTPEKTIAIVSRAIAQLMAMGQFIDASLYFNDGLEVLKRMPDTASRKCVEIGATYFLATVSLFSR